MARFGDLVLPTAPAEGSPSSLDWLRSRRLRARFELVEITPLPREDAQPDRTGPQMSSASAPVPESTSTQADVLTTPSPTRLVSIDVFRGWVMFMMLAHVLAFCRIAKAKPDGGVWELLCHHWSHVPWRGLTLHDLIQPGFSFLVGTALAFSIAGRRRRGQSDWGLIGHAAWRSVVLVLLGVFLRSLGRDETNWTFEDTLSQIGLGYLPLVLIALAPGWVTPVAIGVILVGYWFAFAIHPLP
ncbi:MAG: hypothetical protein EA381_17925, partial [Planctomycetaceae bacterium]